MGKDCDGKEFAKMCKDCAFVNKKFTVTDCDLIFAAATGPKRRRMAFDGFKIALGKIAKKKGTSVADLQQQLIDSGGPHFEGTKADSVRFHDDKSSYTGTHFGK